MKKILKSIKPLISAILIMTILTTITASAAIAIELFKRKPQKNLEETTIETNIDNTNLPISENIPLNKKNTKTKNESTDKQTSEKIINNTSAKIKNISKDENNPLQEISNNFSSWNKSCEPNLIIVNKDNELPDNFNTNLSDVPEIFNNLNSIMIDDLKQMFSDAKKAGINLFVSSSYRSIPYQQKLYNNKISYYIQKGYSKKDAEIEAAKVVARPKTSEHHTGLALDLNGVRDDFYKTKEFKWLMENAQDYGFILRYPKDKISKTHVIFEPWHFRYVGPKHAKIMASKNICLEEYIEILNNN